MSVGGLLPMYLLRVLKVLPRQRARSQFDDHVEPRFHVVLPAEFTLCVTIDRRVLHRAPRWGGDAWLPEHALGSKFGQGEEKLLTLLEPLLTCSK